VDSERMLLRVERGNGPRIVTRCCRRSCSNCCAPGGRRVGGATCCCREVTSIPRPRFNCAAVGPPALPRCPCRCPGRGDVATHAAPQLHHPPLRARCRYSRNSHTSGHAKLDVMRTPLSALEQIGGGAMLKKTTLLLLLLLLTACSEQV